MAARDFFHDSVKMALEHAGWKITHDPYRIDYEDVKFAIDLGAEKLLAAQKDAKLIAIEVKSFLAESFIYEFHAALGQFINYRWVLEKSDPDRELFLAVPVDVYEEHFRHLLVQEIIQQYQLHVLVFNPENQQIEQWIS